MVEKEIKKGEKDIGDARKERDKGKYKKAAKKFLNGHTHFIDAATKLLVEGAKKTSGPADDLERALEILMDLREVLPEFLEDENLRSFFDREWVRGRVEDLIELLSAWPRGFEDFERRYEEGRFPVWALLDSEKDQDGKFPDFDFMGLAFLGSRSMALYGVEVSGYLDSEAYTYYGTPSSKIVNVEISFTGKEEIVRGYDERFKRRYLVGPPINMSNVIVGGEQKMIYVLPSKHHISDARLKNTDLDEVLKLIPPGYWNKNTFEDDFGASERLFKSLSVRRTQTRVAPRAPKTPTPSPPTPFEEPTSKPDEIHATPSPKFCTHCGHRMEPEDLFCGNCGAKV